jgi:hypothetical protein
VQQAAYLPVVELFITDDTDMRAHLLSVTHATGVATRVSDLATVWDELAATGSRHTG